MARPYNELQTKYDSTGVLYFKFLFQSLGFGNSFLKDHYVKNTKF